MKKEKTWWRLAMIYIGLQMLRFAGTKNKILSEDKDDVRERRKSFLPELVDVGYKVQQMTEYHFRINGRLDIYPTNARWHDIKTGKRGGFNNSNLASFVRKYFQEI